MYTYAVTMPPPHTIEETSFAVRNNGFVRKRRKICCAVHRALALRGLNCHMSTHKKSGGCPRRGYEATEQKKKKYFLIYLTLLRPLVRVHRVAEDKLRNILKILFYQDMVKILLSCKIKLKTHLALRNTIAAAATGKNEGTSYSYELCST